MGVSTSSARDAPSRGAGRLILRGDWYRPGESLWGAIHKLAYLNPGPPAAFAKLLLSEESTRGTLGFIDLRCWGPISTEKFASALGLHWSASDIALATLEPFSLSKIVPAARFSQSPWSVHLRYCPICLQQGLHSTIHQVPYIAACPWHGILIVDRCRHGDTIPYAISRASLSHPMCCPHGELLWPAIGARRWGASLLDRQVEDLRSLARWMVKQRECVPPPNEPSKGTSTLYGQPQGADLAVDDAPLVPLLEHIVRGPGRFDVALPATRHGSRIVRGYTVEPRGSDRRWSTSGGANRARAGGRVSGVFADCSARLQLRPLCTFEARFVGWVRRYYSDFLARFKRRHLDSHRRCVAYEWPKWERAGYRQICLLGAAYRLCDSRVGVGTHRGGAVRRWYPFEAEDLEIFLVPLLALLDVFSQRDFFRTGSPLQRNAVLQWLAEVFAEIVARRTLESNLKAVLLECLSAPPWRIAPRHFECRDLFVGEGAFTPVVLATEGGPITITVHSVTELSGANWQKLIACTDLCDVLSSPTPDPASLCVLLDSCGLAGLRSWSGRTIREFLTAHGEPD